MGDTANLMLGSTRPLQVLSAPGSTTVITVQSGDTVFYGQTSAVSAANADGSLTAGQSLTVTGQEWVISASLSAINLAGASGGSMIPELVLIERAGGMAVGTPASTRLLVPSQVTSGSANAASIASGEAVFAFNPADYARSDKTLQVSLAGSVWVADADPAQFSLSLYPVATFNATGSLVLGAVALTVVAHAAGGGARPERGAQPTGCGARRRQLRAGVRRRGRNDDGDRCVRSTVGASLCVTA
jgi:hypothetical protein